MKGSKASESRLALLELARAGVEPAAGEPPDAWDALADAYQAAGEPAKAAAADDAGRRPMPTRPAGPPRRPAIASAPARSSSRPAGSPRPMPRSRGWPMTRRPGRSAPAPGCSAPSPRAGPGLEPARRLGRRLCRCPRTADPRLPRRPGHRRGPLAARRAAAGLLRSRAGPVALDAPSPPARPDGSTRGSPSPSSTATSSTSSSSTPIAAGSRSRSRRPTGS